jgi:hypothetical protein
VLKSGCIEAGLDFFCVGDGVVLVVGPEEVSGFGLLHEVLNLFDASLGFFIESLNVDGNNNVKVGNRASQISDFFKDDVAVLGRGDVVKQNDEGDHGVEVLGYCVLNFSVGHCYSVGTTSSNEFSGSGVKNL